MNIKNIDGPLLKKMIIFAAKNLENNKKIVNDLNVFPVPDGDTGTNMALTIQFAAKEVAKLQNDNLSKIADAASSGSLMGARGNSGVILSQLFRGFAKACKNKNQLNIKDLSFALQSGANMAYKAVMKPTEGTILTVAREGAHYAVQNSESCKDISMELFLEKVIQQSKVILKQTPDMLPVLKEAGVVDAGGKGLIYILEGAYKAFFQDEIKMEDQGLFMQDDEVQKNKIDISTAAIKYAYCTEFMILAKNTLADKVKLYLAEIGDSLVVVSDDNRIKVHVHTNNPGKAIEHALKMGEITNIKIDNMKEQHRNQFDFYDSNHEQVNDDVKEVEEKAFAFISVATGEGITKVLQDLGVESVIQGGQTMNPSTEDFLIQIEKLNAKHIYILPNNGNILLAANQAKQISDRNIDVLPTKTIPQGISALLAFNPEKNEKENYQQMEHAIGQVKSGQVTFAIRNTQVNNMKIKKDDIIGLYEGKIVAVGQDINEVTIQLINEMIDENDELMTLFSGQDISGTSKEQIQGMLENEFSNFDIEIHSGDQPLYYYIIAIE